MKHTTPKSMERIERLTQALPAELSPRTDLWPAIAERIDSPVTRQLGRLPREIATARDLWPEIRARLETNGRTEGATHGPARPRITLAAAAGLLAVASTALLLSIRVGELTSTEGAYQFGAEPIAHAAEAPSWMIDELGRVSGAPVGTPAARLGETASLLQRDFLMVRSERLRIEQALADAPADRNLRTQWRHVYSTELDLIDEAQRFAHIYGTRSEI